MPDRSRGDVSDNLILLTDSYKVSHHLQYPPGTQTVYSYFESRGGRFDAVVFFGLQYYLERYFAGAVITRERIDDAEAFLAAHFDRADLFNRAGWEHIVNVHGGRLPVRIRAVPEGTPVPVRNVLLTIENTDPACFWLTNYLETLLVQLWYGCTVATLSREMKRLILAFLERTGDPSLVEFKLHDFGFRGVSSVESAAVGAAAHLVNFRGTDTLAGCLLAARVYDAGMAGFLDPRRRALDADRLGSRPRARCVSQHADPVPHRHGGGGERFVRHSPRLPRSLGWRPARRGAGARTARWSSGPTRAIRPRTVLEVLHVLGERFGSSTNGKGYRVLPPQVRVIQGDAIDYDEAGRVLATLAEHGWSADNISFGMGGALLQKLHRDTQQFAFKCSAVVVDGIARDVFKAPIGDPSKASKPGRLKLVRRDGVLTTVRDSDPDEDLLREVFRDGEVLVRDRWEDIRARAAI